MSRYDHSSSKVIALAVILGIASIISVLLRILARTRSKAHLGVDDLFAVVALCGFLAYMGLIVWGEVPLRRCLPQRRLLQLTVLAESYNGLSYEFNNLPLSVLKSNLKVRTPSGSVEVSRSLTALGNVLLCCNSISSPCGGQIQSFVPL